MFLTLFKQSGYMYLITSQLVLIGYFRQGLGAQILNLL